MHFVQAIMMGIVQGLSEFLPISSSAHLVFTSNFYKVFKGIELAQNSNQEIFLDIMLHLGTLIAVFIFFKKDITGILKALLTGFKTKNYSFQDFKMGIFIILGTIITVLIAYPLSSLAEKLVFKPELVGVILVITGIILLASEYFSKKLSDKKPITLKNSIIIAIAQGLAALPGFSRSGLTIAAGLFSGIDRTTAARYSFLLSIPIIMGASLFYPLLEIDLKEVVSYNWVAISVGTLVSGITGYLCIKYFMKFLSKFSLAIFGYYCLIMGVVTGIFFTFIQ